MTIIKAATIRFSDELHKKMKIHLLENDMSLQEYIVKLVKEDIGFTKEEDPSDYLQKK